MGHVLALAHVLCENEAIHNGVLDTKVREEKNKSSFMILNPRTGVN